jgi:very-short-patch-repair endonuclease
MLLQCDHCGVEFQRSKKEINRHIKRGFDKSYCSKACAVTHLNNARDDLKEEVIKQCKYCGKEFTTLTGAKSSSFCSRSCASKGSVTDYRRDKALEVSKKIFVHGGTRGLEHLANMMKKREGWKYVELEELLNSLDIKHEFEYVLPSTNYICDLVLFDQKLLIEFDGPNHKTPKQAADDDVKGMVAAVTGDWNVVRIKVPPSSVIDPACILSLVTVIPQYYS